MVPQKRGKKSGSEDLWRFVLAARLLDCRPWGDDVLRDCHGHEPGEDWMNSFQPNIWADSQTLARWHWRVVPRTSFPG
jgi:hypothetical protein